MKALLNPRFVNPWWLRLLLLVMLGLPGICGWPTTWLTTSLARLPSMTPQIAHIVVWTAYASFIWCIVGLSTGTDRLLGYLSVAFVFGLTVAILGALMRKLFPILAAGMAPEAVNFKLLTIFINITIFLPYSLLVVNSFSAKTLIERAARLSARYRTLGLHLALAFRVLQHTGEVIFNLFDIWKETHPELILPRHRGEWHLGWRMPLVLLRWTWQAVHAWIFACIIHTFEPIPSMVEDIEKINQCHQRGAP